MNAIHKSVTACTYIIAAVLVPTGDARAQANCPNGNTNPSCPNNVIQQRAQQAAQARAQQEAQARAQQAAQARAQQEAQARAQQAAQARAQQEAQARAQQEAQARAQQEAQARAQQEAQARAQQEAQARAQQESQARTQREAQARAPQEGSRRSQVPPQNYVAAPGSTHRAITAHGDAATSSVHPAPSSERPHSRAPAESTKPLAGETGRDVRQARAVALDSSTVVHPRSDGFGYTAERKLPGGARIVVSEQKLASGGTRVVAYREKASRSGQTVSRIYLDGHRTVQGHSFHSEAVGSGPQFIKYKNGLHAAYLANGRPLYTERLTTRSIAGGKRASFVERTTYTSVVSNGAIQSVPIVRYYPLAVTVGAVAFYAYQPIEYPPRFYLPLYQPFVAPLVVGSDCPICPPTLAISFQQPTQAYTDPLDLVGDNVIADGAVADAAPPASIAEADALTTAAPAQPATDIEANTPPPPPDVVSAESGSVEGPTAEVADLRGATKDLTQRIATNAATGAELSENIPDAKSPSASPADTKPPDDGNAATALLIPEYARMLLRREVRFDVALQRNEHMLLLPTITKADYGKIFVFQAASPIDVTIVADGAQCTLSSGDLIGFLRVPSQEETVAPMKVITSHNGHCRANETVAIEVTDLQDMLNAFSERVEREMKRMNACMSSRGPCVGT